MPVRGDFHLTRVVSEELTCYSLGAIAISRTRRRGPTPIAGLRRRSGSGALFDAPQRAAEPDPGSRRSTRRLSISPLRALGARCPTRGAGMLRTADIRRGTFVDDAMSSLAGGVVRLLSATSSRLPPTGFS